MYKAFADGRATKSPEDFWYQGEIGFFDFYIIPLAKKLQQCEIFGNSTCEEYLNHALANREGTFLFVALWMDWFEWKRATSINDPMLTVRHRLLKI